MIDVNDALRGVALEHAVQLPHLVHPDDPYLRIGWTARKVVDNSILYNTDSTAIGNATLSTAT